MIGIDISHWDVGKLDYREIKQKFDFVIIKATDGTRTDPECMTFYNSLQNGPQTGFYAYTYATTQSTAKAEAVAFCKVVKPCSKRAGLWLDVEDKSLKKLSKEVLTAIINTWLDTAKSLGFTVGLYSNPSWLEKRIDLERLTDCPIWLAVWTDSVTKLIKYRDKYRPAVIQYCDDFKLSTGKKVDGDIIF